MPAFSLDAAGGWVRADGTSVRYCGRSCAFALEIDDAGRLEHKSVTRESHGEHVELDGDDRFELGPGQCSHCGEALSV